MEIDLPFEPAEYERLKRVGHYFQSRDEPAVAAGIYADLLGQSGSRRRHSCHSSRTWTGTSC